MTTFLGGTPLAGVRGTAAHPHNGHDRTRPLLLRVERQGVAGQLAEDHQPDVLDERPRRTAQGYWFVFTLDRDSWPRQGANTLRITLLNRDPDVTPAVIVQDVELETKYLMGKNFRRGHDDPALGPFEGRMGGIGRPWLHQTGVRGVYDDASARTAMIGFAYVSLMAGAMIDETSVYR